MVLRAITWLEKQTRPEEGWLAFLLALSVVSALVAAVVMAGWVPEVNVVIWTGLSGFLLAIVLARRPIGWRAAWALLMAYGLVLTTIWLGRLLPSSATLAAGWGPSSAHLRQNLGLLVDRAGGWLTAAFNGERSEETIIFAMGLGLLAWLLAAYAGWSTFRQRRPLAGLTAIGFALAVNGYFGDAPFEILALFTGLAVLLAAAVHFSAMEKEWASRGVDYSLEIRVELLLYSGGIAMGIVAFTYFLPTVNFRAISQAILDRPIVHQAEDTLERIFAGVQHPETTGPGEGPGAGGGGITSVLPRGFLLGNAPELYWTVVMTATVQGNLPPPTHWRGASYDVYTGAGWAISSERQEPIAAGAGLPHPEYLAQRRLEQRVRWQQGEAQTRYTLGLPLQFDPEVVAYWRGLTDLSRVRGQGNRYTAVSQAPAATPAELRLAINDDVPEAVLARYTALPETVPERVIDLAREVAGDPASAPTPYDQARALERFLRQYPYSLEVKLPPRGTDPVDYFLFELQAGYCDYYASAMVVMARSLGLPARLAIGFLPQTPDEAGEQTIYEINAHSWAEVYFAGYGWVEFEPTAAFETGEMPVDEPTGAGDEEPAAETAPPPIPEQSGRPPSYLWSLTLLLLLPLGWWFWRRRRGTGSDGLTRAYGQLLQSAQRLGQPTPPSQTPAEFEAALIKRLVEIQAQGPARQLGAERLGSEISRLATAFSTRQYSRNKAVDEGALQGWRAIRYRLWLLGVVTKLRRSS